MQRRNTLIAVGLGCGLALAAVGTVDAGPRSQPKPRQAAGARQVEQAGDVAVNIQTLTQYSTQALQLPRDHQRRAFEALVTLGDEARILELQPYSIRSADFKLLVQNAAGELVEVEAPEPMTYRGSVRGVAGSEVRASLVNGEMWANITMPGSGSWTVQPLEDIVPGAPSIAGSHIVYPTESVIPTEEPVNCGVDHNSVPANVGDGGVAGMDGGVAGLASNRILDIGVDADFEYFQENGNSVFNTVNDIENLLNAVEFIYERDVDITFEITVIIVRSDVNDPYTSSNAGTLLDEFQDTWNTSPESGIRRDVGQLFTGKNISGGTIGIAALGSTCFSGFAYSMVESKYTTNFALRQSLSAHELGHTLNALHCDGDGDCHIMCSGNGGCNGISGSNLTLGTAAEAQITNYVNSNNGNCMGTHPTSPLLPPFFEDFEGAGSINTTRWTYNDGAIVSTNGVGEPSGTRSANLDSTGSTLYSDDELRTNFINLQGQTNQVVAYFTQHRGVENGETLTVEYWASNIRWTTLNTITSNGTDQNQFMFHQHALPANALHSEFRLRFRVDGSSSDDDWYVDDVFVGGDPGIEFGACCLQDFTCMDNTTQDQCFGFVGATWQGADSSCGEVDCTPPLGACCLPGGSCLPGVTQSACEVTAGGAWQGDGVACGAETCLPPTGACCLNTGACLGDVPEATCAMAGGTYQGDDVLCVSVNCPQPTGACCLENGNCQSFVTAGECATFGGTYQGNASDCGNVSCPQPTGACCLADGQCLADVTEDDCVNGNGGTYQGTDSACGEVFCPGGDACIADLVDTNTFMPPPDGIVDGADLAFLLGEWGDPGSIADIVDTNTFQPPPDGVVDGADLAYLLGDWGPCP